MLIQRHAGSTGVKRSGVAGALKVFRNLDTHQDKNHTSHPKLIQATQMIRLVTEIRTRTLCS